MIFTAWSQIAMGSPRPSEGNCLEDHWLQFECTSLVQRQITPWCTHSFFNVMTEGVSVPVLLNAWPHWCIYSFFNVMTEGVSVPVLLNAWPHWCIHSFFNVMTEGVSVPVLLNAWSHWCIHSLSETIINVYSAIITV